MKPFLFFKIASFVIHVNFLIHEGTAENAIKKGEIETTVLAHFVWSIYSEICTHALYEKIKHQGEYQAVGDVESHSQK